MRAVVFSLTAFATGALVSAAWSRPSCVSVNPSNGSGSNGTFTARFFDPKGGQHIAHAFLRFQAAGGKNPTQCAMRFDPATNRFYLLAEDRGNYLGPIVGGGSDSLRHDQCLLSGDSTGEISGNTLTVHFAAIFSIDLTGTQRIYLSASDTEGITSGSVFAGNWTVTYVKRGTGPHMGISRRKFGPAIPADPILPTPTPTWPSPVTATSVNCADVRGDWTDSTTGGTWALAQTGSDISGELKVTSVECGSVTWQVSGKMDGKVASLHAGEPKPALDTCGVRAAASIDSTLIPGCGTGDGKVQINREGKVP